MAFPKSHGKSVGELTVESTSTIPVPRPYCLHVAHVTSKLLKTLTKQVRSGGQASAYLIIRKKGKNYNQKHLCIVSSAAREISNDLEEHLMSYSILFEKGCMVMIHAWAMN